MALNPAARKFDVLPLKGALDVVCGYPVRPELVGVEPYPDLPQLKSAQLDVADVVDSLKLFLEDLVDVG